MNIFFLCVGMLCCTAAYAASPFKTFLDDFVAGYKLLPIPDLTYDYRDYFSAIPSMEALEKQEDFFAKEKEGAAAYTPDAMPLADRIEFEQMQYEITFNLQRIALEKKWVQQGRHIPVGGLHELPDHEEWYSYFIKLYTSVDITPKQVYDFGTSEVKRVKSEIQAIRTKLGFPDSASFYEYLQRDTFYITDKQTLISLFEQVDSIVRAHLPAFIGDVSLPVVYPMEWPDAGPNTPPGIYLNRDNNAYGKDVFQFNFYGGRYNRRTVEWLYMHEAIPGHHLQSSLWRMNGDTTGLQALFIYPGNFEGWACYVEYLGKEFGLYRDPYSYLGKWEWDLVRSARLVMDAGIHYYGWTHDEALAYWKETIPGQDDIAEREVTRVTNWAGQTLSYKVGADYIKKIRKRIEEKYPGTFDEKRFHRTFLSFGDIPLEIIEKNFEDKYLVLGK